jgi:alkylation response protein AidB-like acyl-CoA dehydrogenase
LIADVAREVATAALDARAAEGGHDRRPRTGTWDTIVELGWHEALIPAEAGGAGLELIMLAPVAESLAIAGAYPTFAATAIDAVSLLSACATDPARDLLSAIAGGNSRPAVVWDSRWPELDGVAPEEALVIAYDQRGRDDQVIARVGNLDGLQAVERDSWPAPVFALGGAVADAAIIASPVSQRTVEATLAVGAALDAAAMVGIARQQLFLTTEYARERVQFDKPIGSFQSVQHHCADMYLLIEQARLLTSQALRSLAVNAELSRDVLFANVKAAETAIEVMRRAHRIHGGIAYYTDYPLESLSHSALTLRGLHGSPTRYRERLRELLRTSPELFTHERAHGLVSETA